MNERPRIADSEPDFNFPNEHESSLMRAYYAQSKTSYVASSQGDTHFPLSPDQMRKEVMRLHGKVSVARAAQDAYRREDTSEIPLKMLKQGVPLTIDDIYAMVHVYFWWNENYLEVEEYLESVIEDLSVERFIEAVRVLHAEFPQHCFNATKEKSCTKDGIACFESAAREDGAKVGKKLYRDTEARYDYLESLLSYTLEDYMHVDDQSGLRVALERHAVFALARSGLTDLEATDAPNVLHLDGERREVADSAALRSYISGGGTFEGYLADVLPREFISDEKFPYVVEEFDDLPVDVMSWDESKKLALARRFVNAYADFHRLALISLEWEDYGVVPPYLYRFRPDGVFPGEI